MSDMAKRVGAVVREEFLRQRVAPTYLTSLDGVAPPLDWSAIGRAAIAAMREPTEAMVSAGYGVDYSPDPLPCDKVWQGMIDEALKP